MSTLAANEQRRQLRYNYTPDERITKAVELAEALNRIDTTTAELDRIKADYKARLAAIESQAELLRGCVTTGYEMREYLCRWSYDEPAKGRKTLRKTEGGEIVTVEDMTEHDRQMVMQIIDAEAAAAGAANPPVNREKLALPPIPDWPASPGQVILTDEQAYQDTDYDDLQVADMLDHLREVFLAGDHSAATRCVRTRSEAADILGSIIDMTPDAQLQRLHEWLSTGPRVQIPGVDWMRTAIADYLDDIRQQEIRQAEAAKAAQAAAKKKARSGRRASSSGTVDVPSDEGTRDDAGSDSKNNL